MTPAKRSKNKSSLRKPRIALALAGGGPLGAIYEIGALCALDSRAMLFDDPNLPETLSLFARLIGCIFYANLTPADQ
jgi:hypothetical protein